MWVQRIESTNLGAQSFKYRLMDKRGIYTKMEYIHHNPVAAGLCVYPEDYKYSSAKFYETGKDAFGFLTHWMGENNGGNGLN